jgi:hypothetical protein
LFELKAESFHKVTKQFIKITFLEEGMDGQKDT